MMFVQPRRLRQSMVCAVLTGVLLALSTLSSGADVYAPALEGDLAALSSDAFEGRELGMPGGRRAADYIAARFAEIGLQPLGEDGYFQPFQAALGGSLGEDNVCAWGGGAMALGTEWRPFGFSGAGSVTAPVVFAGYGLRTEDFTCRDYESLAVAGKIVVVVSGYPGPARSDGRLGRIAWPRTKAQNAHAQGAAGFIYIRCASDDADDQLDPFEQEAGRSPLPIPAVCMTRAAALRALPAEFADVLAEVGDAVLSHRGAELGEATVTADVRPVVREGRNVVGLLPGSDAALASEYVVVGGHYDHVGVTAARGSDGTPQIHNGADDNASGASGVIALARSLSALDPRPRRPFVFVCFDGEEEGLHGSAAYTAKPPVPLGETVAMANLDMIGRMRNDQLYVFATSTSPQFAPILDGLGARHGIELIVQDAPPAGSDHANFVRGGVPSAFFFTGLHQEYHTPQDDLELLNVEGEVRALGLIEEFVRGVADADERPQFVAPAR